MQVGDLVNNARFNRTNNGHHFENEIRRARSTGLVASKYTGWRMVKHRGSQRNGWR